MGILRTNTLSGLETPTPVTGSVVFDGTGDYLTIPQTSELDFGLGDFTIELWAYFNSFNGSLDDIFMGGSGGGRFGLYLDANAILFFVSQAVAAVALASVNSLSTKTWNHIAVVRKNTILYGYINGVQTGSASFNITLPNGGISIGAQLDGGNAIDGYISNLRVLKGTALYTGNFTPPTRELQPIGDTVLLCCNNSTSATAEATGKTITVNGNAVASTFSPGLVRDFTYGTQFSGVSRFDTQGYFVPPSGNTQNRYTLGLNEIVTSGLVLHLDAGNPFSYPATGVGTKWTDLSGNNNHGTLTNGVSYTDNNRGALVFDGSDDYVNTPNSASLLAVGNGSFTLAAWFKLSGTKTWSQNLIRRDNYLVQGGENRRIIDLYAAANTNFANFSVYDGSGINATGSQNLNDGLWHYVVGVYESSTKTQYLYVDGVLKTQAVYNNTQSFNTSNESYAIGNVSSNYTGEPFFGNIGQASIYNRALTAAEVSHNYEALKGRYGLP